MKKIMMMLLFLSVFTVQNSFALGYVSRDCPGAHAKESFTMSWFNPQWLFTYSVLLKKQGQSGMTYDVFRSGAGWEKKMRSNAGIHPWNLSYSMSDYWAGVYGIHYWYNLDSQQVESRRRFINNSCDLLNWGVNNW